MSGILISSTGNQNILVHSLHVFCDSMFSLEIHFHTFDIDVIQMSFSLEETPIRGFICNIWGKKFKIKRYMEKHLKKSTFFLVPSGDAETVTM